MNNKNMGLSDYWIPAKEHKRFRRLYFTFDKIFVIRAPNDGMKMYLTVGIVVLFLLLSAYFNQSVIVSGVLYGIILGSICGTILIGFISIVIITIIMWSFDKKLKDLSSLDILKLNRDNYFINFSDISNIELNPLPKTFFKNEGELLIVAANGTYMLNIPSDYFGEIKNKIMKINEDIVKELKDHKKLKIKNPKEDVIKEQGTEP
jgi:hypothetical protein